MRKIDIRDAMFEVREALDFARRQVSGEGISPRAKLNEYQVPGHKSWIIEPLEKALKTLNTEVKRV